MKRIVLLIAFALLAGCTQPEKAKRLLEDQGYSEVRITGYNWWACSDDDTFHTGFVGKTPAGRQAKGTVCAGLFFKGATIRFD